MKILCQLRVAYFLEHKIYVYSNTVLGLTTMSFEESNMIFKYFYL